MTGVRFGDERPQEETFGDWKAMFVFALIHIGHICCSYYFNSSSALEERFLHKLEWRLSEFEFGLFSKTCVFFSAYC